MKNNLKIDETLGKPITETKEGKAASERVKKMTKKEKEAFEKRSEKNYKKIMKEIEKDKK